MSNLSFEEIERAFFHHLEAGTVHIWLEIGGQVDALYRNQFQPNLKHLGVDPSAALRCSVLELATQYPTGLSAMRTLCEHGASLKTLGGPLSALDWAVISGNKDKVDLILEKARTEEMGVMYVRHAMELGMVGRCELLEETPAMTLLQERCERLFSLYPDSHWTESQCLNALIYQTSYHFFTLFPHTKREADEMSRLCLEKAFDQGWDLNDPSLIGGWMVDKQVNLTLFERALHLASQQAGFSGFLTEMSQGIFSMFNFFTCDFRHDSLREVTNAWRKFRLLERYTGPSIWALRDTMQTPFFKVIEGLIERTNQSPWREYGEWIDTRETMQALLEQAKLCEGLPGGREKNLKRL